MELKVEIQVDSKELDAVTEKAEKLVEVLEEAKQLIDLLSGSKNIIQTDKVTAEEQQYLRDFATDSVIKSITEAVKSGAESISDMRREVRKKWGVLTN